MTIWRFLYVVTNWWKNTGLENLVEIRRNFESSMRRPRDMNIYSTILWGDEFFVYRKKTSGKHSKSLENFMCFSFHLFLVLNLQYFSLKAINGFPYNFMVESVIRVEQFAEI